MSPASTDNAATHAIVAFTPLVKCKIIGLPALANRASKAIPILLAELSAALATQNVARARRVTIVTAPTYALWKIHVEPMPSAMYLTAEHDADA